MELVSAFYNNIYSKTPGQTHVENAASAARFFLKSVWSFGEWGYWVNAKIIKLTLILHKSQKTTVWAL